MKLPPSALAFAATVVLTEQAAAEGFQPVRDENTFIEVVEGRDLTRFGITLEVTSAGQIRGRAFGTPVTGQWRWQDGYFCRDLFWGDTDLGANCQEVRVQGDRVRFISDRGQGMYADLSLR